MNPKQRAIQLNNKEEIIDAYLHTSKMNPDKNKVMFLINTFNEVNKAELLTWSSYACCGDCQRALKNFFKYVIEIWQKTS